ncbi:MAG: 3-phosphoshikimate 1-carboxyvinyltransferase [Alphaproteobacteria bacterium]|nr:3-phosphoshikimate 1-carboxyvinyltransferase [Alphaproteobacteria bacterium]
MTHTNTPYPLRSSVATQLKGDATIPGDKSISHRALMLSSQVLGKTHITGLLEGEDVLATAGALRSLGVSVARISPHTWEVQGVGIGGLTASADVLDMGNSGTSTRLLMGLVTPYPFTTFFTGDASLRSRPMARVSKPLEEIGASLVTAEKNRLPLALTGTKTPMPITYRLPVASAQVKSAVILAGLNTRGTTTVIEPQPTRDHTENMLRHLGFTLDIKILEDGARAISISGQQTIAPADRQISVPSDPSSAAFAIVAALICKNSSLSLHNVCINPTRTGLFTTLIEMGAKITFRNERIVAGEPVADLIVESSRLKGIIVPAERAPSMIDEYPILAVAAAFAEGKTVMHGLAELRVKESDRLAAIVDALNVCGVEARAEGDSLIVNGASKGELPRGGGTVTTHFDHRIAMSFLVMGMASQQPITVDDATAIATSFPDFVRLFNQLGADIEPLTAHASGDHQPFVIAIDGPAASGKGTLARRLAEYFDLDYLDTGSLYRAVGMKVVYAGGDPSDLKTAVEAAKSIDAEDLANPRLRQEHIGKAASIVSAFPEVRAALLEFQRQFATRGRGAVLDGRDIGTVVCPDADFKFFITATLYARAKRRHRELQGQGIEVVFESVLEDLRERDERDQQRSVAPLKPADDATTLDTSTLDADAVFERIRSEVTSRKTAKVA